jgi:hypothetical protein
LRLKAATAARLAHSAGADTISSREALPAPGRIIATHAGGEWLGDFFCDGVQSWYRFKENT